METRIREYEPLFGSWYITDKIDEGSVGQLFRIRKTDSFGNEYTSALKVISIPNSGENEIRAVLASGVKEDELEQYYHGVISNASNEFGILAKLKGNTNIINYEDHEIIPHKDSFGWDILIRMEELTPLMEYASSHEMSEEDVLKMGVDLCRGLALCSEYKVIHRDIKPENIFVSDNGTFKIGDFGIARIVEQTKTSLSRKGTYTYMAPEMFRGDSYTENVDLYSLGLVMYKYLNHGRGPFLPKWPEPIVYEDSEKAFAMRLSGKELPLPESGSPRLKEIVCKACAYDAPRRYGDGVLCVCHTATPEQAIEATLGRETCRVDVIDSGEIACYCCNERIMHCNGCGHEFGHVLYDEDGNVWMSEQPNFCPNCGARVVE